MQRIQNIDVQIPRHVDVAVVGAGVSGCYSAYRLRGDGLNVELFEYSNRIGGRIYTSSLPTTPNIPVELGAMRYVDGVHKRVQDLVEELGLTSIPFGEEEDYDEKYYIRGRMYYKDQFKHGDVPYNLSAEEKQNQGRIFNYYLEKLTGCKETPIPRDKQVQLKAPDGQELYKLTFDEAFNMVATEEGKKYLKDLEYYVSEVDSDSNALAMFNEHLSEDSPDGKYLTLKEGMSALPMRLVDKFLQASKRHKLSLNRHLKTIRKTNDGLYSLRFAVTETTEGVTQETGTEEMVYAKKIILAVPVFALGKLDWEPLRQAKVQKALRAVVPVPIGKVFMAFPSAWWQSNSAACPSYTVRSDTEFGEMYEWTRDNVAGLSTLLAAYNEMWKATRLKELNSEGRPIPGSAPSPNGVSEVLKDRLLDCLAKCIGLPREEIPEPVTGISQFWASYPYGGGWITWKAGHRYDQVVATLRQPSPSDDVFVVGSDCSFGQITYWMEGALETADGVIDRYFKQM